MRPGEHRGSSLQTRCKELITAIDGVAGELVGDSNYFKVVDLQWRLTMATVIPKIAERYLMVRRSLRPSFELMDKTRLIDSLRIATELAGRYEASSTCKDDVLRQQSNEMRKAIHKLVTSFTGDPRYFSSRPDPLLPTPTPEQLDGLATTLFNAFHQHPQNMPAVSFDEIEKRGLQDEIQEWRALRSALEIVPNTMFVALQNLSRLHDLTLP